MCVIATILLLFATQQDPQQTDNRRQEFEKKYSVTLEVAEKKIQVKVTGGSITGTAAELSAVSRYMPIFLDEFGIYPKQFIQRSKLQKVVICTGLAFAGQRRAAVPDFVHNTLYLDCHFGYESRAYQQIVIHHEFFHIVDYRDDGLVYKDDEWTALNTSGFKYGKGGAAVQEDSSQGEFRNPTIGLLTKYSTSGVEEDKAELFAHLIVNPSTVSKAIERDPILDRKVTHLKALLRRFSDDLNDDFWNQVQTRRKSNLRR